MNEHALQRTAGFAAFDNFADFKALVKALENAAMCGSLTSFNAIRPGPGQGRHATRFGLSYALSLSGLSMEICGAA